MKSKVLSNPRLSESPIWQIQKKAYDRLGIENWAEGNVPFHMTNNSRIAAQYADIICACFPNRPFVVLELGGGCGKLAYLLIRELLRRHIPRFRYLLTDASEKNVTFWRNHSLLKEQMEQGILQIALVDPLTTAPPLADLTIANYFFDSIPHDLFRVEGGELWEGRAFLKEGNEQLSAFRLHYDFRPLREEPYPGFPEANQVLETYRTRFKSASFLFPIGALQVLRRLTTAHFPVLAADKGVWTEGEVANMQLTPAFHGSAFSFAVNFHAIQHYMRERRGSAFFSSSKELVVSLLSKKETAAIPCFKSQIFGPLKSKVAPEFSVLLEQLEEEKWDATLFFFFFDHVRAAFEGADSHQKENLFHGICQVLERFYPLFREELVNLERLGLFLKELGFEKKAAQVLQLAARFQELQPQGVGVERWLEPAHLRGEVLQIGEIVGSSDVIRHANPRRAIFIPWNEPLDEGLGSFDAVFLFPTQGIKREDRKKPSFLLEIEEQFSLNTRIHSDADIEAFFSLLKGFENPKQILLFFYHLKKQKNITERQLQSIAQRLKVDIPLEEEFHFFETLQHCLKRHMKAGSLLRAFLPNLSTYEEAKFLDEIAIDPYLEYEEHREARGVWLTLRKIGEG